MKHYYEQSKHGSETKRDWKGNEKNKGKWDKKRGKPQDIDDKENVVSHKNFNAVDRVHGF